MQQIVSFFMLSIVMVLSCYAGNAHAVKKCQDKDGKWHYGDTAGGVCENSKITVMNGRGVVIDELEVPQSDEEIALQKKKEELEKQKIQRQRVIEEERIRVLSSYESEKDIDRLRSNQLKSVQGNIDVHNTYLSSLDRKIKRIEAKIPNQQLPSQKEALEKQIVSIKEKMQISQKEVTKLEQQMVSIKQYFEKERAKFQALKKLDTKKSN